MTKKKTALEFLKEEYPIINNIPNVDNVLYDAPPIFIEHVLDGHVFYRIDTYKGVTIKHESKSPQYKMLSYPVFYQIM